MFHKKYTGYWLVPEPAKAKIQREMRHMLEQLQIVVAAIAENDLSTAAEAARDAGAAFTLPAKPTGESFRS